MALVAKIKPQKIQEALLNFSNISGRYSVIDLNGITIIDDTYNANPDSMKSGLESISKGFKSKEKILVLGDMLELGSESQTAHCNVGKLCAELVQPNLLITVGKHSLSTRQQAIKEGLPSKNTKHFETVDDLLQENIPFNEYGNLIYAKGSFGIQLKKLIGFLTETTT